MITVAAGVTIGLFVSQVIGELPLADPFLSLIMEECFIVYLFGTRKNAAHFAF